MPVQNGNLSRLLFSPLIYNAFGYCQLLCLADEMKLFLKIVSVNAYTYPWEDLDNFFDCTETVGLKLNFKTCRPFTFTKSRFSVSFCLVHVWCLPLSSRRRPRCLWLTRNPSSMAKVTCKEFNVLSREYPSNLNSPTSLKSIFRALVRLIVEYGWVRNPATTDASDKLERIHRRLLRIVKHAFTGNCPPYDYAPKSFVFFFRNLFTLAELNVTLVIFFENALLVLSVTLLVSR